MLEEQGQNESMNYASLENVRAAYQPQRRKKIMIIDDDQDFRLLASEILVNEGFSVATARDGEAGLNSLLSPTEDLPNLILVDVIMPVKSGLEFRREQRKIDEIKDIPVLFISGQGLVEGESCLLKPFEEGEFFQTIRSMLGE